MTYVRGTHGARPAVAIGIVLMIALAGCSQGEPVETNEPPSASPTPLVPSTEPASGTCSESTDGGSDASGSEEPNTDNADLAEINTRHCGNVRIVRAAVASHD